MQKSLDTYNPSKCAQTYMYKDSVLLFTYKIGGIIWQ